LGVVRSAALSADLFNAVVSVADTSRFLPYDKDRRWLSAKDERVVAQAIIHRPGLTVIPTLSTRGRGLLKIHYYGRSKPDASQAAEWARAWCAIYGATTARLIWFEDTSQGARTRLMHKTFGAGDQAGRAGSVMTLTDCPHASTFGAFAEEIGPRDSSSCTSA
jgi:hypothetical protein